METKIKVNEEALKAWFEPEWERQLYLLENAVPIIREYKYCRKGRYFIPDDKYSVLESKIAEINVLLSRYSGLRVEVPIEIKPQSLKNELLEKLNSLNMDQIEEAAYDEVSMEILMEGHFRSLAKPMPFTMLSYAITNHFWHFCGAPGSYVSWSNPVRDYGNMCMDLDKMKNAIYTHLVRKLTLWAARGSLPDVFGNEIKVPKQFCIEE